MNITRRGALKGIGALTIGAQLGGAPVAARVQARAARSFDVAAIERDRVIEAAKGYLKQRPITITASCSRRAARADVTTSFPKAITGGRIRRIRTGRTFSATG